MGGRKSRRVRKMMRGGEITFDDWLNFIKKLNEKDRKEYDNVKLRNEYEMYKQSIRNRYGIKNSASLRTSPGTSPLFFTQRNV